MTVSLPDNGLVLFSCEGGFEDVVIRKLLDAVIDMAVAIRTKRRVYTFSRDIWFSSAFSVAEGDDIEIEYCELDYAEGWAGEPDEDEPPEVKVARTVTVL